MRVLSGLCLIAVLLGVLYLDERLPALGFRSRLLLSVVAMEPRRVELGGLLAAAGCPPSDRIPCWGGVMAIVGGQLDAACGRVSQCKHQPYLIT